MNLTNWPLLLFDFRAVRARARSPGFRGSRASPGLPLSIDWRREGIVIPLVEPIDWWGGGGYDQWFDKGCDYPLPHPVDRGRKPGGEGGYISLGGFFRVFLVCFLWIWHKNSLRLEKSKSLQNLASIGALQLKKAIPRRLFLFFNSLFRTPPVPSVFEHSPVYQPASLSRTSQIKFPLRRCQGSVAAPCLSWAAFFEPLTIHSIFVQCSWNIRSIAICTSVFFSAANDASTVRRS